MALATAASSFWNEVDPALLNDRIHWYVAHLHANREKRTAEEFALRSVEHFLPLYESRRDWKDRRVTLCLPLFPGYLFVRIRLRDRLQVLQVPGVARLVCCAGHPVALPDAEMDALRQKLDGPMRAEPHRYLPIGRRVRVTRGPLEGLEGFLVRHRQKSRIVISIHTIQRSIAAEVEISDVEPMCSAGKDTLVEGAARRCPAKTHLAAMPQ